MDPVETAPPGPEPQAWMDRIAHVAAGDPRVCFVYLFGSRASGQAGPGSDVDLAVWTSSPLTLRDVADLQDRLSTETDDVDLVVLNEAPLWLQFRILGEGRLLHSRDEALRIAFRERVEKQFLDFRHLHDAYLGAVRSRARAGTLSRG